MAKNKQGRRSSRQEPSRKVFNPGVSVEIGRNKDGAIAHLRHIFQPFEDSTVNDVPSLADTYVVAVAHLYGFNEAVLAQLRRVREKVIMGTHVVSYAQTLIDLPIWQAGLTALVHTNPLRVTSSYQTVHVNVPGVQKPSESSPFTPSRTTNKTWIEVLGLDESQAKQFRLNETRLLIYRLDPAQRFHPDLGARHEASAVYESRPPTLPLPPLPASLHAGQHYVVTEVLFSLPMGDRTALNWRAFVEAETGAVVYLRAFVACATGDVFLTDPMSATGVETPASPLANLNLLRQSVSLPGLTHPNGPPPWVLEGDYVCVKDFMPPVLTPPAGTTSATSNFSFNVNTDDFAAVSAYYHCRKLFEMMEGMGFNIRSYCAGTAANPGFPIPVDSRGCNDGVNAEILPNSVSTGCMGLQFGRADLLSGIGIATDPRIVAHEFCHILMLDSIQAAEFEFAHSAGDALAAILHDPGSKAIRGLNFPWIAAVNPGWLGRRNDRPFVGIWVWGGDRDLTLRSYARQEILTTTLFRIYRVIGGDLLTNVAVQKAASRKVVYLLIYGIGLLGSSQVAPADTRDFADALMTADASTIRFANVPGGCLHKIIRWGFEKQGLFVSLVRPTPNIGPGDPPTVDVFIDDGRVGEYEPFLEDFSKTTEIWNRHSATPSNDPTEHQDPIVGTTNYLFVRINNRGTQPAGTVVVRAYRRTAVATMNWPADWEALTTPSIAVPGAIGSGESTIVGPFEWTPVRASENVLASVSDEGDLSNIDPASPLPCATGPTPIDQLVPFDNNIAMRTMPFRDRPSPPAGVGTIEPAARITSLR